MRCKTKLRERREALHLTQRQVADMLGIAESAYQRYEYGTNVPVVYTAIKLARALNASVEALFVIEDK